MYAPTSMPLVRRTRATFRSAEFGFFGVVVYTRVQTPRFCGAPRSAGVLVLLRGVTRPFLTSWFTVGMKLRSEGLHNKGRQGQLPLPTSEDGSRPSQARNRRKPACVSRFGRGW